MYIPLTACKQYCLAAGATQGNIAYTQTVSHPNLIPQVLLTQQNTPILLCKKTKAP